MKARKDCSNLSGRIILDLIHNVRNELWKLISKILIVLIKIVLWWNGIFLIPESSSTNRDFVDNHICLSEICSQRYFLLLLKMFKICHCLKKKRTGILLFIYTYMCVCVLFWGCIFIKISIPIRRILIVDHILLFALLSGRWRKVRDSLGVDLSVLFKGCMRFFVILSSK